MLCIGLESSWLSAFIDSLHDLFHDEAVVLHASKKLEVASRVQPILRTNWHLAGYEYYFCDTMLHRRW